MSRRLRSYFAAVVLLALSRVRADERPRADAPGAPRAVLAALAQARIPTSAESLVLIDLSTSRTVAALNTATPRSPASTVKVLTTFASLDILGPAYTWHTKALLRGEVSNGVLDGDLVVQGGGDPFMTLERWWSFARALRGRGLRKIRGNLVIDNSAYLLAEDDPGAFDGRPHRAYNVIPDALMVNFQSIEFRLVPNSATRKVDIEMDPALPNLEVDNRIRYSSGRCNGAARRVDFDVVSPRWDKVVFSGALAQDCAPRSFSRVLMRPADYAFGAFLNYWRQLGGELDGKLEVALTPAAAKPFFSFDSLSLAEIVRLTNKFSSNLMARHLLLTLGQERYGVPATEQKGAQAIAEWSRARGLSLQDVDIDNGSGLSRNTHVTVLDLASVLRAAQRSAFAPEFMASLPLAGIDGTLRARLRDTPAGAARLKTGHLSGVSGVAGFVSSRSGKNFVLVSIVNHARADDGAAEPVHAALVQWALEQ